MVFFQKIGMFLAGGTGYVLLELLWRGRSHISMFFLGGGCFLALGRLWRKGARLGLLPRMVLGGAVCTAGELATGLAVNRDYSVWDYRDQRGNFLGQVCPAFMFLWLPLSLIGMGLYRWAQKLWK